MVRKFTEELVELHVVQGVGLTETLEIMARRPVRSTIVQKRTGKTAEFLLAALEKGSLLSNAVKTCPYMNFDDSYVSFISLAEKTGNLKETLLYLKEKYERKTKVKNRMIEASLYPAFVMFFGTGTVIFLSVYMKLIESDSLVKIVCLLMSVFCMIFYGLFHFLGDSRIYEAFKAMDFLLKSGINISMAVSCAVKIAGAETELGKRLEDAREKLEFGMSLQQSLRLGEQYEEGFYFAEKAGGKNDVFGKLAAWINERDEKRRKVCFSLIEPLFIFITGVFVLVIVMKFFMPFFNLSI